MGSRPGSTRPGAGDRPGPGQGQADRQDRFEQRQGNRDDRFDQRQENVQGRTEFRQDAYKEHHEYHHGYNEFYEDRWKYAMGATLTAATFRALTCTPTTVIVGNVSYSQCGTHWYRRTYTGGSVTYIVVTTPPGY